MKHSVLAAATLGVVVVSAGPDLTAQNPGAALPTARAGTARTYVVPRTPWGEPKLEGTWSTDDSIGIPIERAPQYGDRLFLTDEEFATREARDQQARQQVFEERSTPAPAGAAAGPPSHWGEQGTRTSRQTSFVIDPANGRIPPVTPEAQLRAAGRDRGSFGDGPWNSPEDFTNYDRCITRSVIGSIFPRPYGNGLDIVQAPGFIAIRHEMIHETRVIAIGPRPRIGKGIHLYMGDSRGRWEGDTLVVETTNFTDRTSIGFNGNGLRHSDAMRLVERFRRVDAETIQYEVTIDDPKTYSRPFTMAVPMTTQPGYQNFEYACHEGNYGLPNILRAARETEKP